MKNSRVVGNVINAVIVFALVAGFPSASLADWKLVEGESDLAFSTTKNSAIVESHTFERFSGRATTMGSVQVQVDLGSVETQIPIRNERMGSMLFEIGRFPVLVIESKFDPMQMTKMEEGASQLQELTAKVTLHGMSADIMLPVRVTRLSATRFQAVTTRPVIANASQFDLGGGVEALRLIAKLATITPAVPVTFSLIFESDS